MFIYRHCLLVDRETTSVWSDFLKKKKEQGRKVDNSPMNKIVKRVSIHTCA